MTPVLHPWHRRMLRLMVRRGPLTAAEIGARLYPTTQAAERVNVARHELLELLAFGLVDRDHGRPERWHAGLFAGEALRTPATPTPVPALVWPSAGARDLSRQEKSPA